MGEPTMVIEPGIEKRVYNDETKIKERRYNNSKFVIKNRKISEVVVGICSRDKDLDLSTGQGRAF